MRQSHSVSQRCWYRRSTRLPSPSMMPSAALLPSSVERLYETRSFWSWRAWNSSCESVISSIFGWVVFSETMTIRSSL